MVYNVVGTGIIHFSHKSEQVWLKNILNAIGFENNMQHHFLQSVYFYFR